MLNVMIKLMLLKCFKYLYIDCSQTEGGILFIKLQRLLQDLTQFSLSVHFLQIPIKLA